MTLPARQAEFAAVLADLRTLIANSDADVQAQDPDRDAIQKLREQASAAMGALGFNSQEPQ
jgi:hypothetical protein